MLSRANRSGIRNRWGIRTSQEQRCWVYHQLFRAYQSTGQQDKAWCVSEALSFFNKADVDGSSSTGRTGPTIWSWPKPGWVSCQPTVGMVLDLVFEMTQDFLIEPDRLCHPEG